MSSPLDAIQAANLRSLEKLRNSGADNELLVALLEASCLLELAKLEASRLDPRTYLQQAADVIAQMFPVGGCAITFSPGGVSDVEVTSGTVPPTGSAPFVCPIVVGGTQFGELRLGTLAVDLGPTKFFTAAAQQLSTGLAAVVEAERLKRTAAIANASRVASGLDGQQPVAGLEELVDNLSAFPGAVAAELHVEHPLVGAPLSLRAGYWDTDGADHPVDAVTRFSPDGGRVVATLRGPAGAAAISIDSHIGEILEHLAGSLDRLERTTRLQQEVETDPLTGLGNRRRLERALAVSLSRAERYGERVALLMIDLDGFKEVNDTLGHDVGDRVLKACAQALSKGLRRYDEVVRVGGDELVVLAPTEDVFSAVRLGEHVRRAIAKGTAENLPPGTRVTASIGVAVFPDSAEDGESLMRAADKALYRAKGAGRDAVMLATPEAARPCLLALATEPPERLRRGGRWWRRRRAAGEW